MYFSSSYKQRKSNLSFQTEFFYYLFYVIFYDPISTADLTDLWLEIHWNNYDTILHVKSIKSIFENYRFSKPITEPITAEGIR